MEEILIFLLLSVIKSTKIVKGVWDFSSFKKIGVMHINFLLLRKYNEKKKIIKFTCISHFLKK